MREAVRKILRPGGSQIKVMPGGGVASNFDPLESTTLMEDGLRAAVEAATDFGTYVCAHAYTDESINRFLDAGGRWVAEHGVDAFAGADMILVDGNPLEDVGMLADYDNAIKVVIKNGEIYQNNL